MEARFLEQQKADNNKTTKSSGYRTYATTILTPKDQKNGTYHFQAQQTHPIHINYPDYFYTNSTLQMKGAEISCE